MRKMTAVLIVAVMLTVLAACGSGNTENTGGSGQKGEETESPGTAGSGADFPAAELRMEIDGVSVEVSWEDNETVSALKELVGDGILTIETSGYGGFEQVGPLGTGLPGYAVQTTTSAGDIVLYSGDKIVLFYGSNTWSYIRLGKIEGLDDGQLREMLSGSGVSVELSMA